MCALAEPTFYVRVASVQNFPNFHVESTQKPFVNAILLECTFKKVIRTPFTLQNPAKKQPNQIIRRYHTLNRCCWCLLSIFLIFAKNRINRRKKCEFFHFHPNTIKIAWRILFSSNVDIYPGHFHIVIYFIFEFGKMINNTKANSV